VTGWLLDTNVLSELRRPKPDRKVVAFIATQPLELLYVSAVTLAEIRFGIEIVTDATKRAELNDWLAHKVRPMFEQCDLPVPEEIIFKWRLLVEDGRKAGSMVMQIRRPAGSSPISDLLRRLEASKARRHLTTRRQRSCGTWHRQSCRKTGLSGQHRQQRPRPPSAVAGR
jgi:toxin FitB